MRNLFPVLAILCLVLVGVTVLKLVKASKDNKALVEANAQLLVEKEQAPMTGGASYKQLMESYMDICSQLDRQAAEDSRLREILKANGILLPVELLTCDPVASN